MLLSYIVFLHQTTTHSQETHPRKLLSYIVFLHQTTTLPLVLVRFANCLISSFYIKPQPSVTVQVRSQYCLISSFYIKPQLRSRIAWAVLIVLYRLSTSNHNHVVSATFFGALSYIVFLHQTTTLACPDSLALSIFLYRLSTSNHNSRIERCIVI